MSTVAGQQGPDTPLIDVAHAQLKRAIIYGELSPGTKLKVNALSERYGLSSSPIREALNRLTQEGIVRAVEHRGYHVAPLSLEEFRDITRLRCLLEAEALRDAIEHGDDEWEASAIAAFHRLSLAEKKLKAASLPLDDDWSERHKAFHLSLLAGCPSALLLEMVQSLFDKAERYRRYSMRYRKAERHKVNEHKALLDVTLERKADAAVAQLRQHIQRTLANIEGVFQA